MTVHKWTYSSLPNESNILFYEQSLRFHGFSLSASLLSISDEWIAEGFALSMQFYGHFLAERKVGFG